MINNKEVTEYGKIIAPDNTAFLRMWQVKVPSGKRILQRHSHIYFEITYVDDGSGIYSTTNQQYSMQKGDMFIFSSNEQHCITDVGNNGLVLTNLHFEPRYLWGNSTDTLSDKNINFCFFHNKDFQNKLNTEKTNDIYKLLNYIKEELINKKSEYALSVKSLLNFIVIDIIRNYNYAGENSTLNRSKLHSIRRVIKYIDLNLSSDLSLKKLSDLAGISPNYFSSVFHEISGITLWDYINSRRIDAAIKLLMEENRKSIIEIASLCGYNNTANFNKAFKKVTGMTPTVYCKSGDYIIR